ncbi:hypothetical protein DPMN_054674 [Dreissena polymorpha]|uniref:Uncharacterized protein n=1 Tax=Dreissena polymorpha TaxID=45954 RepID=A0A9D4CQ37_DREPO|nr:hypothetical protein DPMN_054674 [Dreissena polymorpha]
MSVECHRRSGDTAVANTRANRRRGPARTDVRLKFYLLPMGDPPPRVKGKSAQEQLIAVHHSCGFGYPNRSARRVSLPIHSTTQEV